MHTSHVRPAVPKVSRSRFGRAIGEQEQAIFRTPATEWLHTTRHRGATSAAICHSALRPLRQFR